MYFTYPEFSDFVAAYEGPGLEHARRYFARGTPQVDEVQTAATPEKWTSVRFPKALVEQVGSLGWSVPTADLLRRAAVGHGIPELGRYYERLADSLGEAGSEPVFADLEPHYRARQLALSELYEAFCRHPEGLSGQASGWLRIMLRDANWDLERGTRDGVLSVSLPMDFPPPGGLPGEQMCLLAVSVGAEMTRVANEVEASEPSRAAQLRTIVDRWYPDEHADIEVRASTAHFWLTSLRTADSNEFSRELLQPIEGSVHIDHCGSSSAYSQDGAAHRYRIYGVLEDLEPGELIQRCLLVCDSHALLAEVCWDEDAGAPIAA